MEKPNLMISKEVEAVTKLISMYSVNEDDRELMSRQLLTEDPFDIEELKVSGTQSKSSLIFDEYLYSLGLEIIEVEEDVLS